MTSKTILSSSLLAILVAACNHGSTSGGSGSPVTTSGAARSHGDLVPSSLVSTPVLRPTAGAVLSGSDALVPRDTFGPDSVAPVVETRTLQRAMKGSDPTAFQFPIDNPLGARVLVRPLQRNMAITSVHMHSVDSGLRLDHGRDASDTHFSGSGSTQREPSFAPLVLTRTLSFDEPFKGGLVQLDVSPDLAAAGVIVEVQQPNTHISLRGQTDEVAYAFGDRATLSFSLADDGKPIDGASVTAWVELPDHSRDMNLTLRSTGGGTYSVEVPMSLSDAKYVGAWGIHVTAAGSSNGVAFEREVEAGLGYWPAHARMSWVGSPEVRRGGDGLVDGVSFDVGVETLDDDQFSVRGILTFTGSDGLEHPLASAQTGQVITRAGGTMTLSFEASSMAFAQANGPFHLRNLALISQSYGVTQHRIGRGLDLATPALAASEIRVPAQIPLHVQEMIAAGDLVAPK